MDEGGMDEWYVKLSFIFFVRIDIEHFENVLKLWLSFMYICR